MKCAIFSVLLVASTVFASRVRDPAEMAVENNLLFARQYKQNVNELNNAETELRERFKTNPVSATDENKDFQEIYAKLGRIEIQLSRF